MTHLRVLLKVNHPGGPEETYRGAQAIRYMCELLRPKFMAIDFSEGFEKWNRAKKLLYMAQYLPKYAKLTVIRERKNMRKNKSLYLQLAGVPPLAPKPRRDPIRGGNGLPWNEFPDLVRVQPPAPRARNQRMYYRDVAGNIVEVPQQEVLR